MIVVRFYRALMWVGMHWLRKLPLKDRWGFNLGDDLDEWALAHMGAYIWRLQDASRLTFGVTTEPPKPFIGNTTAGAATVTITRTFPVVLP